jgi:hypothetical protein
MEEKEKGSNTEQALNQNVKYIGNPLRQKKPRPFREPNRYNCLCVLKINSN